MKRSAVGVMNGNWRQRWNDELSVPVKRNECKEIYTAIRPFFTDEMCDRKRGCGVVKELKNCPLCGGEAKFEYDKTDYQNRCVWVECKKCSAKSTRVEADTTICANEIVVEAWNRRTNDQEPPKTKA